MYIILIKHDKYIIFVTKVIQRRLDGCVSFNHTYQVYEEGFGWPAGEFWIGKNTKKTVLYFTGRIMLD